MQLWEYQVIHLNVDSSGGGKDGAAGPTSASSTSSPPFTKTYLEQEFPNHYGPQQPPGATPEATGAQPQQPQHPALQLQGFINGHGRQGWELLGIFPLGSLLMMIFRRPLPEAPSVESPPAKEGGQEDAKVAPAQAVAAPSESAFADVLKPIVERLSALEERLTAGASTPARRQAAVPAAAGAAAPPSSPDSAWVLSAEELHPFQGTPGCSSTEAARSLGFRSPASLLNPVARHGYPVGLVRVGRNGKAAIYQGQTVSERGGRDTRLWLVIDRDRLPSEPA